jgi:hypothetical protein
MRLTSVLAALAIALTFSASGASGAQTGQGRQVTDKPDRATTGTSYGANVASKHGANKKGFCPPGQKKKPGKGSAFNC